MKQKLTLTPLPPTINRNPNRSILRRCLCLIVGLSWLLTMTSARAVPLDFPQGAPDISATFITVTYDALLDTLSAIGTATNYLPAGQPGPPIEAIAGGTFELEATINENGELLAGTLSIGGTIAALGFNSGSLLTATLTQFGFPDAGGDPLEFLFDVNGGDAASAFGDIGGVLLNAGATTFPGDFSADFSSAGASPPPSADTSGIAVVPTPATLPLLLVGVAGLAMMRSRRKRSGGEQQGVCQNMAIA